MIEIAPRQKPTANTPPGSDNRQDSNNHAGSGNSPDSIVLRSVGYTYDSKTPWAHEAISQISLTISPGSRLLVVGENGSGKSTLAWILAGLVAPTVGEATLGDAPLSDRLQDLGFVVQHTRQQLLSATIGEEFSAYGIDDDEASAAMSRMGLAGFSLGHRLEELSVGQQRRVGLAIIFARSCPIVILDEPLAGLDSEGARSLTEAVRSLPEPTTLITVSHDLAASTGLATNVIELESGSINRTWAL